MTSSSPTKRRASTPVSSGLRLRSLALPFGKVFLVGFGLIASALLSGCIADSAEDSDLPWASNKNWEGIAPIAPTMMERYE